MTTKRLTVKITREIHPAYAAHLEALEAMGFDLERVITIAQNAVWNVGTTVPSKKSAQSTIEHWSNGHHDGMVQLVASAEYCREPWEKYHSISPAKPLWPEAVQRVKDAVSGYLATYCKTAAKEGA
jgi:hypothetical protein